MRCRYSAAKQSRNDGPTVARVERRDVDEKEGKKKKEREIDENVGRTKNSLEELRL